MSHINTRQCSAFLEHLSSERVKQAALFHRLNARLYRRVDATLDLSFVALGLLLAAGTFDGDRAFVQGVGLVIALVAYCRIVIGPARKAEQHKQAACAFAEFETQLAGLDLQAIDAELVRLRAVHPDGLTGLVMVAYNSNLATHGRTDYVGALSWWNKVLAACV